MHPRDAAPFYRAAISIHPTDRSRLLMAALERMTCRCQFIRRSPFFISCYSRTRVSNVLRCPISEGINIFSSQLFFLSRVEGVLSGFPSRYPPVAMIRGANPFNGVYRQTSSEAGSLHSAVPCFGIHFSETFKGCTDVTIYCTISWKRMIRMFEESLENVCIVEDV